MSKISKTLFRSFLALIVIVIGNYVIIAQETLTGECRADVRAEKADKQDKIQLSFNRENSKGGRHNMSSSFAYADLKGLTREQALAGGQIRFSLEREAGTIVCDANFAGGKGTGTFTFTPNRSFIDAMQSRGFDFTKSDYKYSDEDNVVNRLFAAATLNVTTALADDLLSSNFGKLDTGDLFKAAIFKVDGKFAREMKDSGFQGLTFDDLVKARIFKIDAEFVRDVAAKGFQNEPFESLVKMKIFNLGSRTNPFESLGDPLLSAQTPNIAVNPPGKSLQNLDSLLRKRHCPRCTIFCFRDVPSLSEKIDIFPSHSRDLTPSRCRF